MASNSVPKNVLDRALYLRVKSDARRKFRVYPSIPANAWLSAEYKRRGGRYSGPPPKDGLREWFDEEWVDLSRPKPGGGWEPCMRDDSGGTEWREAYPKCVPLAKAEAMSPEQRASAVRRKRAAMAHARPGKPTRVPT